MAVEWIYTDRELIIFDKVKKRVTSEFKLKGLEITGGIFIKPKPQKSRLDLFELNGHQIDKSRDRGRITKDFTMKLNINYQDTDQHRVNDYTEFLYFALIDSPLTNNLIFRRYYQDMEYQTFRISPYLWLGNCPFYITHISSLKIR